MAVADGDPFLRRRLELGQITGIYKLEEAAAARRISLSTLRRLINAGQVHVCRDCGGPRIHQDALDAFEARRSFDCPRCLKIEGNA